jgi:hypothetical protein
VTMATDNGQVLGPFQPVICRSCMDSVHHVDPLITEYNQAHAKLGINAGGPIPTANDGSAEEANSPNK